MTVQRCRVCCVQYSVGLDTMVEFVGLRRYVFFFNYLLDNDSDFLGVVDTACVGAAVAVMVAKQALLRDSRQQGS